MKIERVEKAAFSVIGKEGSTEEGEGFVQRLWEQANGHFEEVAPLAKRDDSGALAGIWGLMSDPSRRFAPWTDGFSRGLYLAGVECADDAQPPSGWTKWTAPGFVYLQVECEEENVFQKMIAYLEENHIPLAGAVQDFTCPSTGKNYMRFPVERI